MRVIDYPLMPRPQFRDPASVPVELVADANALAELVAVLDTADAVAVDTETTDALVIDNMWYALRVCSIATRQGSGAAAQYRCFVLDVRDLDVSVVADVLAHVRCAWGWNADFDQKVLELYGAPIGRWADAKLDEALYWTGIPGRGWYLALAEAARRYLNWEVEGKGSTQMSFTPADDLSQEQVEYAGYDALLTLWLAELFEQMVADHDLGVASGLEQGQRPFLYHMMQAGFPFDLEAQQASVAELTSELEAVKLEVFAFAKTEFNLDSAPALKEQFNALEPAVVQARLDGRLLERSDKIDAALMKELTAAGSKLADLVLRYRHLAKQISTYGESFAKFCHDGRIRSRYKQTLTATGRLSSDQPNAQNLVGATKGFIAAPEGRVLVACDYSQAELRALADMSGDETMLAAFAAGLDLHSETARQIFHVDLAELKSTDPEAAKKLRTKTKNVNFGIPYGMQASALARRLTNEGVLTTVAEAREMIDLVMASRPQMAEWLSVRDSFVRRFAKDPGPVDWEASFKLLDLWQKYEKARRDFKRQNRRWPTTDELVELVTPEQLSLFDPGLSPEEKTQLGADLDWAFRYDAPVVVRPPVFTEDGVPIHDPVAFESRTVSGRRRIFAVVMDSGFQRNVEDTDAHLRSTGPVRGGARKSDMFDGLVTAMMLVLAVSDDEEIATLRDTWSSQNKVALPKGTARCPKRPGEETGEYRARVRQFANDERTKAVKAFEGDKRSLKAAFVAFVCEKLGAEATQQLRQNALADCITKLAQAFRNHPIQGGVADISARAFALLFELCDEYPDLLWVQTVHDSIIGECDEANGLPIIAAQVRAMEQAMTEFFPDVPAKVDAEICSTLAEETGVLVVVTSDMVAEALSGAPVGDETARSTDRLSV